MQQIKFGTDGWRAIIADDYTVANVARVAQGTALWLKEHHPGESVVVGHDCRFGGELFAHTTTRILCENGIKVFLAKGFVSTPMVSLGTQQTKSAIGVVITASHNPPSYNGYKLKASFGGPMLPENIAEVEALLPETQNLPEKSVADYKSDGLVEYIDLETAYIEHVKAHFDLEAIHNSGIGFAYDAMYGAGMNVIKKLFPKATLLHADYNPSFMGQAPEPIDRNLQEFAALLKNNDHLHFGLATDGDADRIGLYDANGNFVDAHHIILLLIHYLYKYKNMSGKVVTAFSVSGKVTKLCQHYGLDQIITKIGFKYICGYMVKEDVLLGGEESGGIAVKGHIPERDGIWDGLVILEFMAKSGKSLTELIEEVYEIVGPFAYNRNDLHITNELKAQAMEKCASGDIKAFGPYTVEKTENVDGYKFYMQGDAAIMVRPSGTEPVLRVYAEAADKEKVEELLKYAQDLLVGTEVAS